MTSRSQRACFALLTCCACWSASTSAARADLAGAGREGAVTEHDYRKALLDFNQRTLGEAFEQTAPVDAPWRAKSADFLDAMAVWFTNWQADPLYVLPDATPPGELIELGRGLLDAGCDDPLVRYAYYALLQDRFQPAADIVPGLEKAAIALLDPKYPITRAYDAHLRLLRLSDQVFLERLDDHLETMRNLRAAMVIDWRFENLDRRIIFDIVNTNLADAPPTARKQLVEAIIAAEQVDPWMKAIVLGSAEVTAAWDARGGGYADTVTEQGWDQFFKHLEQARSHLVRAHTLRPEYPEAATAMITVAMGAGDRLGEDERDWFEKAVAAQFDYRQAYKSYRWSLRPRWGGTHEQMHALGRACLATKRFDTRVPWEFYISVDEIRSDSESLEILQRGDVAADLQTLFEGMAANAKPGRDVDFIRSMQAAVECMARRLENADRIADELGERVHPLAFVRCGYLERIAVGYAATMSSQYKNDVEQAEQLARRDLSQSLARYDEIAARAIDDARVKDFVESRRQQLRWMDGLRQEGWVDLQPGPELYGWQALIGDWKVDESGALIGTTTGEGLWLVCQIGAFPQRYEIEATVELLGTGHNAAAIGYTNLTSLATFWGVFVKRVNDEGQFTIELPPRGQKPVELKALNHLRLVEERARLTASLNEGAHFRELQIPPSFLRVMRFMGVGNREFSEGQQIRITGLRMRRIASETTQPASSQPTAIVDDDAAPTVEPPRQEAR